MNLLLEIVKGPAVIGVTHQFRKNYDAIIRSRPRVKAAFEKFIEFKRQNPNEKFNAKDEAFTGVILKGLYHVHLVHGKDVLVYGFTSNGIIIYDIVKHDDFEGKSINALTSFVAGVTANDIAVLQPRIQPQITLSDDERDAVQEELYGLASMPSDVGMLKQALSDPSELITHLSDYVLDDATKAKLIIPSFGGNEQFLSLITKIMRDFGYT